MEIHRLLLVSELLISKKDAQWLACSLLGFSKGQLFLHQAHRVSDKQLKIFDEWVRRRARGEPLQYIVGSAPFYGYEFNVNRKVLIPRPETEVLVHKTLEHGERLEKKLGRPLRVLDVGTGSGAIAITLKKEKKSWHVAASDISKEALLMAKKNSKSHNAEIRFYLSDLLKKSTLAKEKFDIIVSNPPYLSKKLDKVSKEVAEWEPDLALFPKNDSSGATVANQLVKDCLLASALPQYLFLELSARVANQMEKKWRKHAAIAAVDRFADLSGRKRFLLLTFKHG